MATYADYLAASSKLADVEAALSLLSWDLEVMMPHGAAARRALQIGTLAGIKHDVLMQELRPVANAMLAGKSLTEAQRLNVQRAHRDIEKAARLPREFVGRLARVTSEAQQVWENARNVSDFSLMEPALREVFDLKRQEAEHYGYDDQPYDALLDSYEPGVTSAQVAQLFAQVGPQLKGLTDAIARSSEQPMAFPELNEAAQRNLNSDLCNVLGFDHQHGRYDYSSHPFTIAMGMEDVRITSRIDTRNPEMLLYGTIHELGHAFYELGLQSELYGTPGGQACSLSIHESQSRIWENNVGRGEAFWQFFLPTLRKAYGSWLDGLTPQDVFRMVNAVKPSLIRIMADELTYHAHIRLRYEIERDVVNGTAEVHHIPELWAHKLKDYLGLEATTDADAELQDIHWSLGLVGYFPTYSLGSFYAAQLYQAAQTDLPNLEETFATGQFTPFKQWLNDNVWSHGRLHNSNTLCKLATGHELDANAFMRYASAKFAQVYAIDLHTT